MLREEYEREMNTTLRVAVMLADERPREQIAGRLGLSRAEVDAAVGRLERVVHRIDRDDETGPG